MIPIAAILTPGTISVDRFPDTEGFPCTVGSLRFPFDHNSTAILLAESGIPPDSRVIEVGTWDQDPMLAAARVGPLVSVPHPVMRTLIVSAYTGAIARSISLPAPGSPSLTTVGEKCGDNCSYTVEFLGPSVSCTRFTSWSTVKWKNESMFMMGSDYTSDGPANTHDPSLVGVLSIDEPIHPIVFQCRSSTARYTVRHVILERNVLEPEITKVEPILLAGFQSTAKHPDKTYVGQAGLMHALSSMLYGVVAEAYRTSSQIGLTPLADHILKTPLDMGAAIETMGHKMVVSLVASDLQLNGSGYVLDVTATQETMCTTTRYNNLYVYSARTLILVYALAVACAFVTTVAGFFALSENGMASTKTPSCMIRTTRNPTFDELIVGKYTLGGDMMSAELERMEWRFGALRADETGTTHYALGVRGEISPIKRD